MPKPAKTPGRKRFTWRADLPYNDLPLLPPAAELETRAVLKQCILARAALGELKQAAQLIPNQTVLINTLPLLEATGLRRYFHLVLCGDTLPRRKPDPLPLVHACGQFGIAPAEMVLIGDSLNDVQAARAAGCPVLCVPYGYNEGGDVRDLDCDAIVPTILEAVRLIRKA